MLFYDVKFLFLFLPAVLAAFYVLRAANQPALAKAALVAGSLFFYGFWKWSYLTLLLGSIGMNYLIGAQARAATDRSQARMLTAAGIVANLALLGYFKYADFAVRNVNGLFGAEFTLPGVILPLAISFFTFQQIAWLADCYQGKVKRNVNLLDYALFVSFFPQLIAGPIVHHSEMMPQFARERARAALALRNLTVGFAILVVGMFKKVVIADSCAAIATPAFNAAATDMVSPVVAWAGLLAYTFQIYFDFSGYSDMAVGLALMFGIRLPINFNSPYRARSIAEFWRRWHITLSRFLRDYVYIPLGGNRKGELRRYGNLVATMLIGGIWHGASWVFLAWGAVHGAALAVNHLWRDKAPRALRRATSGPVGWAITFLVAVHAWVFFRAADFAHAAQMFRSMYDIANIAAPFAAPEAWPQWIAPTLALAAAIAFWAPNAPYLFSRYGAYLGFAPPQGAPASKRFIALRIARFRPGAAWATVIAAMIAAIVYKMSRMDGYLEFIYFQF